MNTSEAFDAVAQLADEFIERQRRGEHPTMEEYASKYPDLADEIRYGVEVTEPSPRVVLVDFESITEVDATALITIGELNEELERAGTDLRLARVRAHVLELMRTTELDKDIGPEYIYDSVHAGVNAFLAEPMTEPGEVDG